MPSPPRPSPPPARPNDDAPARGCDDASPALPHVRVTASSSEAELRRQLGGRELSSVRAVSLSAEPDASAAVSWALQQLCRLEQLRLPRAPLPGGLRALGSGLFQLRVLWMTGCALETLDGVCALPRLQELYVADNRLTDLSVCSCLDQLQVLDAEDNQICELTSCLFLRACSDLRSLNLLGNPVCSSAVGDQQQLQQLAEWLPQLETLNGQLTATGEKLLRRLERCPQQQLPPVVDAGGLRRGSPAGTSPSALAGATGIVSAVSGAVRRRQSTDVPSVVAASTFAPGRPDSAVSLPAGALSRHSPISGSGASMGGVHPRSSPGRRASLPVAPSSSSTSPRLPAIVPTGGASPRQTSVGGGEETRDSAAAGERMAGRLTEVKLNTWMKEVAAGKTPPPDRHLTGECK